MKQTDVTKNDYNAIRKRLFPRKTPKKYEFKLNSLVRSIKTRRTFKTGYLTNWTEEIFTVKSRKNKDRPLCEIEDFKGNPISTCIQPLLIIAS